MGLLIGAHQKNVRNIDIKCTSAFLGHEKSFSMPLAAYGTATCEVPKITSLFG